MCPRGYRPVRMADGQIILMKHEDLYPEKVVCECGVRVSACDKRALIRHQSTKAHLAWASREMQNMQRTLAEFDNPPAVDEDDPVAVASSSRALETMAGVTSLNNSPTQASLALTTHQQDARALTAAAYEEDDVISTAMNLPAQKKDSVTSSGHSPSHESPAESPCAEPALPLLALPCSPSPSVTESAQSAGSHPAPLSTGSRADEVLRPINVPGFSAVLPTLAQVVSFAPSQMLPSAEEMPTLDDLMLPSADTSSSTFQIACGSYGSFNY